jgi:hypothetical protein
MAESIASAQKHGADQTAVQIWSSSKEVERRVEERLHLFPGDGKR